MTQINLPELPRFCFWALTQFYEGKKLLWWVSIKREHNNGYEFRLAKNESPEIAAIEALSQIEPETSPYWSKFIEEPLR